MTHGTYPLLENNDGRKKISNDDLVLLVKKRQEGNAWKYVGEQFGLTELGAYYAYHRFLDTDVHKKRVLVKQKAMNKYRKTMDNNQKDKLKIANKKTREKHEVIHKKEIFLYDSSRSLEYYRKNKEKINPVRNKKRRINKTPTT